MTLSTDSSSPPWQILMLGTEQALAEALCEFGFEVCLADSLTEALYFLDPQRNQTLLPAAGNPGIGVLAELQKPGRDPRSEFVAPVFRDDVHSLNDLKPGMQFEGMVTNVTAFGAFVDIGVHQDGLVHISQLADRYVKDPHSVVAVGQRLKVRVLEVDVPRKRIQLTAKSQ